MKHEEETTHLITLDGPEFELLSDIVQSINMAIQAPDSKAKQIYISVEPDHQVFLHNFEMECHFNS